MKLEEEDEKKRNFKKSIGVLIYIVILLLIGCKYRLDQFAFVETEKGYEAIQAPNGTIYKRRITYIDTSKNSIENRFNWRVPFLKENGKDVIIDYTKSRGRVYATTEDFCIYSFLPESSTLTWFDESFVFPKMKAEEFDRMVIQKKTGNITLRDEVCIQAFLDRMLTREYDINKDKVELNEGYSEWIVFYSREHPDLSFSIIILHDVKYENHYIFDTLSNDLIDCTDIIEQYLSEYFE